MLASVLIQISYFGHLQKNERWRHQAKNFKSIRHDTTGAGEFLAISWDRKITPSSDISTKYATNLYLPFATKLAYMRLTFSEIIYSSATLFSMRELFLDKEKLKFG